MGYIDHRFGYRAGLDDVSRRKVELRVGGGFRLPDLTGQPLPRRLITTTFHDTPQRSLARAGITLRWESEARHSDWQLRLPGGDGPIALEEEASGGAPPATLVRLLASHTRHGSIAPVATVCTRRSGLLAEAPESRVAVVLDWVEVISGPDDVQAFGVVEVELVEGDAGALEAAVDVLRQAGAEPANGTPATDALWRRIAPRRRDDGFVAQQLVEIMAHDPGTRLGADPEDLHKHRVAIRRLRAVLRDEPLRTELRWIGGSLGAVRDLDVLIEHYTAEAASLEPDERMAFRPILLRLSRRRAAARRGLAESLDSERYFELLDALEAVPAEPDPAGTAHAEALRQLKKLRKEVRVAGPTPDDTPLHELRKRAKRIRYAAERASAAGDGSLAELGSRAKALQDILGIHQDAVVGEETLRGLATDVIRPAQALAIGRLVERERARKAAARAEWWDAWRKLKRAG
jgi:CHAD domain-containing protein